MDEFDEDFGDLLADTVEVPETPVAQPTHKPAPRPQVANTTQPTAKDSGEPDDEGFVAFGTTVSSIPIPRFKATTASKSRIAVLSKQVLTLKTHYVEGIGNFVCLNDKCCEFEGLPRVRYIIPVVQYTCNKSGAVVGQDIDLAALTVGAEQYDALVNAINFSGRDVQDVDIVVTCSDEQYQKLTFAADASKGATWKTFPGAKDLVANFKANKSKLHMGVARKVSLDTYLTKKGFVASQIPQTVAVDNIEDLLDE